MDEPARQRFLAAQPCRLVQAFARLLGWRDVRTHAFEWPQSIAGFSVAYWSTDERFNLQIGQRPDLDRNHYSATVIAERYGISSVPHQPFQLFEDLAELTAEAKRLFPLLGRANFKNAEWRRQFAEKYPIWVMRHYRRRNKFLNEIRRRANDLAAEMRRKGLNPYTSLNE